jgi:hypothetical protein
MKSLAMLMLLSFQASALLSQSVSHKEEIQPAASLAFDTCLNALALTEQWTSGGQYDASFDTMRYFFGHCWRDADPARSFSDLGSCAGRSISLSTEKGRLGYRIWLLDTVLKVRNDDPWFCYGILQLTAAYDQYSSNIPAYLAILKFVAENARCAPIRATVGDDYARERQYQIHLWQDTAKPHTTFDTTLPSLHDLGLDTLLNLAAVHQYDVVGPEIIRDAHLTVNPFKGTTTLSVTVNREAWLQVDVLDLVGRKLEEVSYRGAVEPGTKEIPLRLTDQPTGTYYLRISSANNEVRTLKLLKQ